MASFLKSQAGVKHACYLCGFPLRHGCKIVAGLGAVISVFSIFAGIVFIFDPNRIVEDAMDDEATKLDRELTDAETQEFLSGPIFTGSLFLAYGVGSGILSLLLFLGALALDRKYLFTFMCGKLLLMTGATTGTIYVLMFKYGSLPAFGGPFATIFDIYSLIVAWSFAKELKGLRNDIYPN